MFGFTRSTLIVAGLAGSGLAVPQASGWLNSQTQFQSQQAQTRPQLSAPSQLQPTDSTPGIATPSQIGSSNRSAPKPASSNPWFRNKPTSSNPWFSDSQPGGKGRRIPIDPVPMPGAYVANPDNEPKTPDLRKIPDMTQPFGTVTAQITLTPICSIVAPADDCKPRPYRGSFKIKTIAGDRTIRVQTDREGMLRTRLDGGVYTIQPEDNEFALASGQTFTIVNGAQRTLQLDFRGTPSQAQNPQRSVQSQPGSQAQPQAAQPQDSNNP